MAKPTASELKIEVGPCMGGGFLASAVWGKGKKKRTDQWGETEESAKAAVRSFYESLNTEEPTASLVGRTGNMKIEVLSIEPNDMLVVRFPEVPGKPSAKVPLQTVRIRKKSSAAA